MRQPAPTNPAQVPLLGASSSPGSPPSHTAPSLLATCLTRRTRSLVQLAIAATLVTASVTVLRHAAPTTPTSSLSLPSLPPHLASVLRLSAPIDEPPAPTRLAVNPARPGAATDDDRPDEPDLDAFRPDQGDGLLNELTTVLTPLPRTKAVSHGEPWVYARDPLDLPPCDRILLFQFMPWWGFASEYILYARAAAAAEKLGYTFLEDDRNWNYGRLRNYFRPRKLSCVPPRDWTDHRLAVPLSLDSALARPPRLVYSRLHLSNLDDWTRDVYLSAPGDQAALRVLQQRDDAHRRDADRWILDEGATLPQPLEAVFDDQSAAVRRMWKLGEEVDAQVRLVRRRSGLARPRWATGEEDALEGEGTRSRRGPVIALHVRLGDKAAEYEHDSQDMGITNSFGNLTVYVEAAHDAYRRLLPSRYPSLSPLTRPRFSPYARPSLLLITAEPDIPSRLRASTPLSRPFLVVQTPEPDVRAPEKAASNGDETQARLAKQAGAAAQAQGEGPKAYGGGGGSDGRKAQKGRKGAAVAAGKGEKERLRRAAARESEGKEDEVVEAAPAATPDLSAGYTQAAFNALPILERVVHTQAFVRDLTVLAKEADAAVVSGASNVGRLAMLIAGKEAVTGPRDAHGDGLGGRIRSVDAHFYPTAYTTAVYEPVADVEDLDNAAFVPKEQFEAEQAALAAKAQRADKGRKARPPVRDE